MRKISGVLVVCSMLGAALSICGLPSQAQAVELRVAHSSNPGQSTYIYWDELAKRVNARANGAIVLKVFPSGQLGGDEQLQRGLKAGTIHMSSIAASNMSIVSNAYAWSDLPYVFNSAASAEKVFTDPGLGEMIAKKMRAEAGTVVLGHIELGGFRILINTKRALKTPADIGGMKLRMLANPIDQALLSAWGASPIAMPWSEVFVAIEQGVADGLQLQPQAIVGFGFDKMIRHGTHTQTLITMHVAQVNAATWDKFSPAEQKLIRDASAEALKVANDADRADGAKFLADLSKKITFYTPTAAELELWRKPALAIWDRFLDKMDKDMLSRVVAIQK
ncbi:TRAP transporter substrate-binding protein [Xanthobacteraceae bacterium Astr-EGSB]|uniref:TRAP transporter substrate-binding protein n=1 Tax=Astrobacterium formosum TaxID=3069710 RepID=UPI0027B42423|nr:TRAP transporter substrate-binding protein [Xanthobacteraceae bacterium Astr-EGSB]